MAQMQDLIRIANTDINGNNGVFVGLTKIKGVNYSMANAICKVFSFDKKTPIKDLGDENIKKIEEFLKNPLDFNIPTWMVNRRKDRETNEDVHLITTDLKLATEDDVKLLRKIKSYKGFRHEKKLPVRGQRTKSNFRRNKGKLARKIKR
ncbi:30S ribosomal protein S13 [Candidatus Woesearchaeota archaeon]|nr:30S ribosomal protein S13 [Candidatus Woesearchaeota archaeon]